MSVVRQARRRSTRLASSASGSVQLTPCGRADARGVIAGSWPGAWAPHEAASWTPIGAAWPNKDGLGFSLQCDAVPLQGRLVLRVITERAEFHKDEAA